ncbi:MAG: hypothetical protein R3270_10345 [Gammaproteobacteria bacterium]|nr:hypothetical protein [Gammaproteobacteria bacterium]
MQLNPAGAFETQGRLACRVLLLGLVFLPLQLQADQPPDFPEYRECSDFLWYCASIEKTSEEELPGWEASFRLVMLDMRNRKDRVKWEQPYMHPGYRGGLVTVDGGHFVYVDQWYRVDAPVVWIYSADKVVTVNGREFGIPAAALKPTVSHKLWLQMSAPRSVLHKGGVTIWLIDGRVARVSLEDGQVSFPESGKPVAGNREPRP